jgi:dethiobiotin synthetase
MAGFFVTGTDTGVGKTRAAVALMQLLQKRGLSVAGMKPIASGCQRREGRLLNDDAVSLQQHASLDLRYEEVNPYAFEPPISPHLAAELAGVPIDLASIVAGCRELERRADCVVVEGIGGWEVPLNERQTVADLATRLALPVILVVGMRLGCLNHGLLSHTAISRAGVPYAGWIANYLDAGLLYPERTVETLQARLSVPLIGRIDWRGTDLILANELAIAGRSGATDA